VHGENVDDQIPEQFVCQKDRIGLMHCFKRQLYFHKIQIGSGTCCRINTLSSYFTESLRQKNALDQEWPSAYKISLRKNTYRSITKSINLFASVIASSSFIFAVSITSNTCSSVIRSNCSLLGHKPSFKSPGSNLSRLAP